MKTVMPASRFSKSPNDVVAPNSCRTGLDIGLQDADKIGHAGSIPVFGHNRNPSIGRELPPLPNPQ
jgi:hypothetical protein